MTQAATKKEAKTIHESFARFFEKPSRETLRDLLKSHLGELRNCDFKEAWPDHGGLAKHTLGLGNSGGGCLIVGVRENADKSLSPIGLSDITDKADLTNGLKNFLPESLLSTVEIADFKYEAAEYPTIVGKQFQTLFVSPNASAMPFVARKGGNGLRAGAIYIRREGLTEEASYEETDRIIKERIAASPQTAQAQGLKEHLEELKVLYSEIPQTLVGLKAALPNLSPLLGLAGLTSRRNPSYPNEDYQEFVLRVLSAKKALIEKLLGL